MSYQAPEACFLWAFSVLILIVCVFDSEGDLKEYVTTYTVVIGNISELSGFLYCLRRFNFLHCFTTDPTSHWDFEDGFLMTSDEEKFT